MKHTKYIFYYFLILTVLTACKDQQKQTAQITTIAFGSCASENRDLPIFDLVVEHKPDLFIFLGDNIYGDTKNIDTLKTKLSKFKKEY
jgi:alkaline phosphatase D